VTLKELCKSVNDALNEHPDAARLQRLARNAIEIASLTGWAPGVIDPYGRFAKICIDLQERARGLYEKTGKRELAELHDALADLREAVAKHDDDLNPAAKDDEGGAGIF
jgi:uncharacterized protein YbjT (DUF2867 family)